MRLIEHIPVRSGQGSYAALVGHGLLERMAELLEAGEEGAGSSPTPPPEAILSSSTVGPLYARRLAAQLELPEPLEIPDGEIYKQWPQVETVVTWMLENGLHRGSMIAAVGGGVVTDLGGFAAAIFMRGLSWIAVPTTLLAMVDASVGGKTGVNIEQGKNLVGCFWPPRLVVADVETLRTLPDRELRAGLAEVIKTAWIADHDLLELVIRSSERIDSTSLDDWGRLVARSVRIKAQVVETDEHERGWRQCLNLGHTVGHALESATSYDRFLHGEAVAWGMRVEARIARARGLLSEGSEQRLDTAISSLGALPEIADIRAGLVIEHLMRDKKRDSLGVAWALPSDTGACLDQRVSAEEVVQALELVRSRSRA